MIYIVTGEKNTGKTTFAKNLVSKMQEKGVRTGGFLSMGLITSGSQKKFELFDISELKFWPLAESGMKTRYLECGRFFFNPDTVGKGESIIHTAIHEKSDLLVMDEIGKCELAGKIWDSALRLALESQCDLLIVVAKKNLESILSHYKIKHYLVFDISVVSIDQAIASIRNQLKRQNL